MKVVDQGGGIEKIVATPPPYGVDKIKCNENRIHKHKTFQNFKALHKAS